ncbi:MAG: phosphoribosyltransferase domain-containing protein [Myxococcaceae bacterium]|nr:phosphoribosyltransferase domain-containing protein [Myxococcaceae bacterium]MCI0671137.1 phosphoribosyltransferase domain-containing protein [Myxococcaceae bacterium]
MVAKRPTSKAPSARRVAAEKLVSIPEDVVLSPQSEVPRQLLAREDRSRQRTPVRELSWAEFDKQVQGLAKAVRARFRTEAVVGLAHGGVFVGGVLASALGCEHYPVRISPRSRDKGGRTQPRLAGAMPKELKGLKVLVVDDISASGESLELAVQLAKKVGAREVKTAALVTREGGFAPDFGAVQTDELVVFPWDYGPVVEEARFDVDKAGA